MEETKCLKPPDSGHEFGDCASVQAATRVNAEQTSHDEGLVKGRVTGASKGLQLLRYPRSKPKISRLHPRRATAKLGQAYEPEMAVEVREGIGPAPTSSDL